MARNGAGSYSLPTGNPVVTGTAISSTVQNNTMTDVATALTQSLAKDGQTTPSANLPMGSFRHTGVGNGVARTDYPSIGQVQDSSFMWCGTATGTANALLLVPTPIVPAIVAGQRFVFKSGAAPNSGATTASISTLATIAVQVNGAACVGGEILANSYYEVIMDASTTSCQLNKIGGAALRGANSDITSLSGLTTPLSIAQGGTAGATAAAARAALGAAASGANSDITSILGLTTPLSVAQGGTGTATAASSPTMTAFTASGTYTKPAGLKFLRVRVVGGGGGASRNGGIDAGGGGGGYSEKLILAASIGATETVTIGAGGAATTAATPGGSGGTSRFGAHCSATGGAGGASVFGGQGGVGGVGSGGTINVNGGDGSGGGGGATLYMHGGSTVLGGNSTGAGKSYGGGGGTNSDTGLSYAGASGVVIVEEFF